MLPPSSWPGFHWIEVKLGIRIRTRLNCSGMYQAALKAHARGRIEESFRYFDGVLARGGPYLLGERFSAADLFFYMLAFWTRRMPRPAMTFASVARLVRLVHARPAVAQMMREEGIAFEIAT